MTIADKISNLIQVTIIRQQEELEDLRNLLKEIEEYERLLNNFKV